MRISSYSAKTCFISEGDIRDLRCCGVAHFLCGVAVKKFPACGVAVISSLTVCDICILKSMVFGEKKLSVVFPFP